MRGVGLVVVLVACGGTDGEGSALGTPIDRDGDGVADGFDSDDDGVIEVWDANGDGVADPLRPLIDPEDCPDVSSPGASEITLDGVTQRVDVYFPPDPAPNLPVVFAWHGLGTPALDMVGDLRDILGLDTFADNRGAIVVMPESRERPLVVPVLLWGILFPEDRDADLKLYDTLRACMARDLQADMTRVSTVGFSGGALWSSLLVMDRGDTLASAALFSGGIGADVTPMIEDYRTPAADVPSLLTDGGPNDVYGGGLIDFVATTEELRDELAGDGLHVQYCSHGLGHYPGTGDIQKAAKRFLLAHTFGVASPYATGGRDVDPACEVVRP